MGRKSILKLLVIYIMGGVHEKKVKPGIHMNEEERVVLSDTNHMIDYH